MNPSATMEWNTKWDWETIDIFRSKYNETSKKLEMTDWGVEEGNIEVGSFHLYGTNGVSASNICHASSAKSSISASTDLSSKESGKASNLTFDPFGGYSLDFSKKNDCGSVNTITASLSTDTSVGSAELSIGLKLGKRTYFENCPAENKSKTSSSSNIPVPLASTTKKTKPPCQNVPTPRCQVEACNLDLSSVKDYHRKHRVCESHSKCSKVVIGGLERRFCQQCSRFHSLSEFDGKKRSCRKRLFDHNARRRKPQHETIHFKSTNMSSIYEGSRQMCFAPISHSRPAGASTWESISTLATGQLRKADISDGTNVQNHLPGSSLPHAISMPAQYSSRLLQYRGSSEGCNQGKEYTYGQVNRDVRRFAKALRSLGLRRGHVVMVVLPNTVEYPIVALGIMAAGGIVSGANPASHVSEIKKQAESAEAKSIVTDATSYEKVKGLGLPLIIVGEKRVEGSIYWSELLDAAARASDSIMSEKVQQSDICALPFSSGTTGLSKGVMLSHHNLVANLCSTLFSVGPELVGNVTTLGLIPFYHIYGLTGICCAALKNKGKVVVMGRYDLRTFLNALIKYEVTFAPIVPPIILGLVKNPIVNEFDLGKLKLRSIMTAAAPLAPEILSEFEKKFPDVVVQEAYGMTEHSCITLTHGDPSKGHGIAKKHSVGFILPNLEVKFIDPDTNKSLPKNTHGEICVRSQCVMEGYYKNEYETAHAIDKDGWLHTGDIGYIDDDGDVFIVDRIKELIKYKGFQVAPAELEGILLTHPSVEDAAVVGLPDEEAGEIPGACVVMIKGAKDSEEEVMNYVASNVAQYKKVRVLQFVDTIPKSSSGKIMRRLIKDKMVETIKACPKAVPRYLVL